MFAFKISIHVIFFQFRNLNKNTNRNQRLVAITQMAMVMRMAMGKKLATKIKMEKITTDRKVPRKKKIRMIKIKMKKWNKRVAKEEMILNLKMVKRVAKIVAGAVTDIKNDRDLVRALKSPKETEAKKSQKIKTLRRAKTRIVIVNDAVEVVTEKRVAEVTVEHEVALVVVVVAEIDEDNLEMIAEADARNILDHVRVVEAEVVVVAEIDAVVTAEIDHERDHARDRAQSHQNLHLKSEMQEQCFACNSRLAFVPETWKTFLRLLEK